MTTFDEKTHTYAIDGNPVPSVTQIISEIVGVAWTAAPWYLERGKAIHKCAEFIIKGKEFKFDDRLAGYITALKSFFKIVKPELIGCEQVVYSQTYRFAGTLDLGCKIGGVKTIIDWKHSIDKNRIPLQLGGYSVALKEMTREEFNHGIGVQIKEDGTFQMTEKTDLRRPRNEFLSLRTAYAIKVCCNALTQKEAANE
jgi:hypothetical protein